MANCSYADELFAVSGRDYQMTQMVLYGTVGGNEFIGNFKYFHEIGTLM